MKDFVLLKRTYPISQQDRYCDGYDYIIKNTTNEERNQLEILNINIQKTIQTGEKYIYQVGKLNNKFKVMCVSFNNHKIIRRLFFGEKNI